jgi:hypothetical protein
MLKGIIVENSLADKSILERLHIEKSWQDGNWTLHTVQIEKGRVQEIASALSNGPWYTHFWESGNDEILVVFKDKVITIHSKDTSTWEPAIAYGKSIGIPEEQLDFPMN